MSVVMRNARAPFWGLFVLAVVFACSGRSLRTEHTDPDAGAPAGGTEDAGGRSGAGLGGASTAGISGTGGTGGIVVNGGSGGSGGTVGTGGTAGYAGFQADPDACASLHMDATRIFPHIFIAVDRSSAMADVWDDVSAALTDLLSRPELDGADVALRFFPDDEPVPSCDAATCNATACGGQLVGPARLSIAPVGEDPHEAAMIRELEAAEPTGEAAPLTAAFEGLVLAAASHAPVGDPQPTSALFVTAGVPSECDGELTEVARVAFEEHGVPVFIAVPEGVSPEVDLDAIAANAGTNEAIRFSRSADPLLGLMWLIGNAVTCEALVPTVEGRRIDVDRTIAYASIGGAESMALLRVSDVTECGMQLAWYFDNNEAPATMIWCPALCLALTSSYPVTFDAFYYCERGGLGGP